MVNLHSNFRKMNTLWSVQLVPPGATVPHYGTVTVKLLLVPMLRNTTTPAKQTFTELTISEIYFFFSRHMQRKGRRLKQMRFQ